jgi:hypothetical protein
MVGWVCSEAKMEPHPMQRPNVAIRVSDANAPSNELLRTIENGWIQSNRFQTLRRQKGARLQLSGPRAD